MSAVEAPQVYQIAESETRAVVADFTLQLESGELLTGSPTVAEIASADLTIGTAAVNTGALALDIDGASVTAAIGTAVQFTIAGALSATEYRVRVSCGTDATPAQTLVQIVRVLGVADGSS